MPLLYISGSLLLIDLTPLTPPDRQSGEQFLYQESQSKQFQNFLIRANRYPSLVLGGGGAGTEGDGALNPMQKSKVVLVEVSRYAIH